jgi:hypothetical protein
MDRGGLELTGQRGRQGAVGLAEPELDGVLVDRRELVSGRQQTGAEPGHRPPALQRGDHVGSGQRAPIVETHTTSQGDRVHQVVLGDLVLGCEQGHGSMLGIGGEQRLVDVSGDQQHEGVGGPVGIEVGGLASGRHPQRAAPHWGPMHPRYMVVAPDFSPLPTFLKSGVHRWRQCPTGFLARPARRPERQEYDDG